MPAGWLADRIGPRILITIGICGVALTGLLVGFSHTYMMLLVFLVLMGILGGCYHPSAPPLVSASVEPKNRGRALGFHLMGGSASYFLTPLFAAAIAATWGWRGSFIGLAIPAFAFGIAFYILLGRRADMKKVGHDITTIDGDAPHRPGRWRRMALFLFLVSFTQAIVFAILAFIPLYMVDHFGVSEEAAAAFLVIIYSAGLWASPLGGYLSDRLGRMPVILTVCLASGPVLYLLNLASYGPGIGAALLLLGAVMYIRRPVSEAYIVGQIPEHNRSTILGIYYLCSIEGGGILTPVMGHLIDKYGFYTSFTISSIILLAVSIACSIFLWGSRD